MKDTARIEYCEVMPSGGWELQEAIEDKSSDTFCFILCDLLKRNTELHGNELKRRGQKITWPDITRKVCIKELRCIKANGGLMAFSGLLWHRLRSQNITTRCIYQLLLQWAFLLTEKGLLAFYTDDYEALILELQTTIEGGADGAVDDIPAEEIIEEWEFMRGYLTELHKLVEDYENKDCVTCNKGV